MKKRITNILSPFIMLLVPMFLMIGLLAFNINKEIPAEKRQASIKLQMPSLKSFIQAAVN